MSAINKINFSLSSGSQHGNLGIKIAGNSGWGGFSVVQNWTTFCPILCIWSTSEVFITHSLFVRMSYSANLDKKFISPICFTYLSNKCSENRHVHSLRSRILPWKCFGAIRDWFRPCTHLSFSFSFVPRAYETMHVNLQEIQHGLSLPMKTFRTRAFFWGWFHKFTKTRTSLILRQAVNSVISITRRWLMYSGRMSRLGLRIS